MRGYGDACPGRKRGADSRDHGQAFDGLAKLKVIDEELCARLKAAVGFRNVAVHNYQKIDWDIVHAITWQHLDDFRRFAQAVNSQITGV